MCLLRWSRAAGRQCGPAAGECRPVASKIALSPRVHIVNPANHPCAPRRGGLMGSANPGSDELAARLRRGTAHLDTKRNFVTPALPAPDRKAWMPLPCCCSDMVEASTPYAGRPRGTGRGAGVDQWGRRCCGGRRRRRNERQRVHVAPRDIRPGRGERTCGPAQSRVQARDVPGAERPRGPRS